MSHNRGIIGLAESPAWLHNDWLLSAFGNNKADAIERYIDFVSDGMHHVLICTDLKQQIYLGDDQFIERVQSLIIRTRI